MFLGLRTAIYRAPDLARAKAWYTSILKIQPYFDQPFYVGYNVGGFELGLDPDPGAVAGTNAYWGVPNAEAAVQELLALGATAKVPVTDVGDGIKCASVLDPFGNILGIIENPHFKLPV
jgi:predicted enzyme related to lactoylglutathione lyase